ncbi:MAG: alpha/beta hydrolase [Promethearchaeota archaeon]
MVQTEKIIITTQENIELEAEYYQSSSNMDHAVVVCHPHPQFGGNMWNNVVTGIFKALIAEDISCLRFNFRAVGKSTGDHSSSEEERKDVKACVDFLIAQKNYKKILICGYSYGAAVGCSVVNYSENILGYVAIAFPWDFMGTFLKEKAQSDKPKLFIQGTRDSIAQYSNFKNHFAYYNEPKESKIIEDADHFYGGKENEIAGFVIEFFKKISNFK